MRVDTIMWVSTTAFRTTTFTLARVLFLISFLVLPVLAQATVFYDASWENGFSCNQDWFVDVDNTCTSSSMSVSADRALTGAQSIKQIFTDVNGSALEPYIDATLPNVTHWFNRFGIYHVSGFQFGGNAFTKIMRFKGDQGWPIFWIEIYNGSYELTGECPYDADTSGVYSFSTNVAPTMNGWDQVELEVQFNTPGFSNGYINMWINGVQRLNKTGLQMIGPTLTSFPPNCGAGTPSPSNLVINDNQIFLQSGLGTRYLDRVAVGNARIGLVSPSSSTTPPPAPTGLLVH